MAGLLALLPAWASGAAAQSPARAPGVAADDSRQIVDITQPPWNSIARVQSNIGGKCTGTVIAPRLVLTAAHCLYNPRTRRLLAAQSLHVLLGYAQGDYKTHLTVDRYHVSPAYDGTRPGDSLRVDWALLHLSAAADVPGLPVADRAAAPDDRVAVAGFNQDRVHLLMADQACQVKGSVATGTTTAAPGGTLLFHDCSASRGTSGGPLLIADGRHWRVGGVNVGITGRSGNVAIWPDGLAAAITALSHP